MIDFAWLRGELLARGLELVSSWLPDGHRAGPEWSCGGVRGEPGRSLSINTSTGVWKDFATGEKGGDLIALYAAIHGLDQGAAAHRLIDELRLAAPDVGRPAQRPPPVVSGPRIGPAPIDAPAPIQYRKKSGDLVPVRVDHLYCYRSAQGDPVCYIGRIDARGDQKKIILQISWDLEAGEWAGVSYPAPRPLYGLDLLAARPRDRVLVVEGERCADAARIALGGSFVVVSWPGGGQGVRHTDWRSLRGRSVLVWPDADRQVAKTEAIAAKAGVAVGDLLPYDLQPGCAAAQSVVDQLRDHASDLAILDVRDAPDADGWDIADAIADGWDALRLMAWIARRTCPVLRPEEAPAAQARQVVASADGAVVTAERPVVPDDACTRDAYGYRVLVSAWVAYLDGLGLRPDANCGWLEAGAPADVGTDELVARFVHQRQLYHDRVRADDLAACTRVTIADWRSMRRAAILAGIIGRPSTDTGRAALAALIRAWTGAESALHIAVLAHWMWQVKRRAAGRGVEWDLMPVLVGRQGSGKTTEIGRLCAIWHELSVPVTATQIVDPREAPLLSRALCAVWDEMSGANRADSDALKRAVSMAQAAFRRLYSQDYEVRRRTATFIGSSNFPLSVILRDTSGARRFAEIPVQQVDWDEAAMVDIRQVWDAVSEDDAAPILAQLGALRDHQRTLVPFDLLRAWMEHESNIGWRSIGILRSDQSAPTVIPGLDPLDATADRPADPGGWTTTQIAQRLAHFGRGFGRGTVLVEQLGQRLGELGWTMRQVRVGERAKNLRQYRWYLDPDVRLRLSGSDHADHASDQQPDAGAEMSHGAF